MGGQYNAPSAVPPSKERGWVGLRIGQLYTESLLRQIFRKWKGVVGTGWSWLGIGTGGGHLCVRFQKYGEFLD